MPAKSIVQIALRQQADIERVVRRSDVLAARLWRAAVSAVRSRNHKLDPEILAKIEEELVDLMTYAYLLRLRLNTRRRNVAKGLLSVHSDAAEIADKFSLNLGKIKKRFESEAKAAVRITARDVQKTLDKALARATKEGLPTKKAVNSVIASLRQKGIQPRSNSYVESLVRTHAAISYGAAHRVSFVGDTDLWGWEYVTVGDNRVRESHEAVDGTRRKVGDPFWDKWWPPNGWNCRCQAVAIYNDDETQTRVPGDVKPDEGFDFDPSELL